MPTLYTSADYKPRSAHPRIEYIRVLVPAEATAGNDTVTIVCSAPIEGEIVDVKYIPKANITGAATNNRSFALVNKGTAGSGTTSVASLAFSASTVTATAYVPKTIPLSESPVINSNGVFAQRRVTEGDVLVFTSTHVGTGIADPGGLLELEIHRVASDEVL
jgi:hypothetical protein